MSHPSPAPHTPPPPTEEDEGVRRAGGFALSEDWLATVVGLVIVVLALLGVITKGWLPL